MQQRARVKDSFVEHGRAGQLGLGLLTLNQSVPNCRSLECISRVTLQRGKSERHHPCNKSQWVRATFAEIFVMQNRKPTRATHLTWGNPIKHEIYKSRGPCLICFLQQPQLTLACLQPELRSLMPPTLCYWCSFWQLFQQLPPLKQYQLYSVTSFLLQLKSFFGYYKESNGLQKGTIRYLCWYQFECEW